MKNKNYYPNFVTLTQYPPQSENIEKERKENFNKVNKSDRFDKTTRKSDGVVYDNN